jgi:hypothetical protein
VASPRIRTTTSGTVITNFICFEITLAQTTNPAKLQDHIHLQICKQGQPLRWSVTATDPVLQTATIEAVITIP